jgi:RNA polymerase sigma-70 factor, ECF subfamily
MNESGLKTSDDVRDELMRMFLRNQDMLSAFLYTQVEDWELVEEALQETTVYVCGHWQEFTIGTNFGAWIRAIARMRCREILRNKKRSKRLKAEDFDGVAESLTESEWDLDEVTSPCRTQFLSLCMKNLPDMHRQVIEMHYQRDNSVDQIARNLDKSIDAVYKTLARARRSLRLCIERRFAEESI